MMYDDVRSYSMYEYIFMHDKRSVTVSSGGCMSLDWVVIHVLKSTYDNGMLFCSVSVA